MKFGTLVVLTLKFIKMSNFITLKSIAFIWRHFKVNICCAHHYPVTQHWHISSPRSLHSGTLPEKPDRDSKRNSINVPGLRRISAQTVGNRLRENGLRARRPYFGTVLRRRHRLARVRWCNRVRDSDLQNWRRVWFSDESRCMLQKRNSRTRVCRHRNERIARNCVLQVDISSEEVGCHILRPKNATGAHPRQP